MSEEKKIDDGGFAFPVPNDANTNGQEGMTLRDWFAGHALSSMNWRDSEKTYRADAEMAYQMADAMLKARSK